MHYYLCLCNIGSGDVVDHVWHDLSLQESSCPSKSKERCGFDPSCLNDGVVCGLTVWQELDGVFQRTQSVKHPQWCQRVMVLVLVVIVIVIKNKQNTPSKFNKQM